MLQLTRALVILSDEQLTWCHGMTWRDRVASRALAYLFNRVDIVVKIDLLDDLHHLVQKSIGFKYCLVKELLPNRIYYLLVEIWFHRLLISFLIGAAYDELPDKDFEFCRAIFHVWILAGIFIFILKILYHFFQVVKFLFGGLLDPWEGLRELLGKLLALFGRTALAVNRLYKLLGRVKELRIVAHSIRRVDFIKFAHGDPFGDLMFVSLDWISIEQVCSCGRLWLLRLWTTIHFLFNYLNDGANFSWCG